MVGATKKNNACLNFIKYTDHVGLEQLRSLLIGNINSYLDLKILLRISFMDQLEKF